MSSTLGLAQASRFLQPRALACGAALVGLLAADVVAAQAFDADAVRLSPAGTGYIDPEILQVGAGLAFQEGDGDVWLGWLDPATGLFVSSDGKDELVDTGAFPIAVSWGGPELAMDANGWSVVYTKEDPATGAPQIWQAELGDGGWSRIMLTGGSRHQTPLVTSSLVRTGTRVLNIAGSWEAGTASWFDDMAPAEEHAVVAVGDDITGRTPVRWARDDVHILYRDELARVHLLNTDTGSNVQITGDGGHYDDPNGWRAPEHGGELVVAAILDDTRIAILRDLGGGAWHRTTTLSVPAGAQHAYYGSPEPVVIGDRSYLSVVVKDQPNHSQTTATSGEVWIIGIEADEHGRPAFARRADDGQPGVFRSDPETFVGADELFVYYSSLVRGPGGGIVYELWRARTGIPIPAPTRPEVTVDDGTLRGVAVDRAHAFRGIRYAAPPTGANRWRPPQPVEPWDGVRNAAFFDNPAPQSREGRVGGSDGYLGDEDCLFLNVWTPADRQPAEQLPVLFFVHGGGNLSGASSEAIDSLVDRTGGAGLYDGARLAATGDVVVVTINYRLGPLGYLALPALDAEHQAAGGPATSGNYAILDQIAALEWVQSNITAFGGDPERVMLFGQSAGARNTSVLLTSPLARGLFSRAAMHSGVATIRTRAEIDAYTDDLLTELGFDSSAPDLLDQLRAVDAQTLAMSEAARPLGFGNVTFSPHIDGWVVDADPQTVINRGEHAKVPFMIGTTSEEYAHRFADVSDAAYEDMLVSMYGPQLAGQILEVYPLADFPSGRDALVAVVTDSNLTCTARRIAGWATENQDAGVYRYQFTRTMSSPARLGDGAYHTSELLFLFQHFSTGHIEADADDLTVETAVRDTWVRMAATGSPDVPWHPYWSPYDPTTDPSMVLDADLELARGLRTQRCDFWDGLRASMNRAPAIETPEAPLSVVARQLLTVALEPVTTDPDGDDVDFAATGLPDGAMWDRETGTLRWRPGLADAGSHTIVITAVDVWGATDSVQLTIDVGPSEARDVAGRADGR